MLAEFEKRIEQEGILRINGAVFKDHFIKKGDGDLIEVKKNITPSDFCRTMADLEGCTIEDYTTFALKF